MTYGQLTTGKLARFRFVPAASGLFASSPDEAGEPAEE